MVHLGYDVEKLYYDEYVPKLGPYFHLTSWARMLPKFFVIGVQKGGSTAMYRYLVDHPEIINSQNKGIFFFNNPLNYRKGMLWYRANFALRPYQWLYNIRHGVNAVTFDGTPDYFDADGAAERLYKHFPDSKLILLLRNPVERAYSCYQMARRFGYECLSFEEALELEETRLAEEGKYAPTHPYYSYVYERLTYKKRGVYINYIKKWKDLYGDKLLVFKSEDLNEHTKEILAQVYDFLGLQPYHNKDLARYNEGNYKEPMRPDTYEMLKAFYEPYNQQLYEYLNRNFGW